MSSGKAVKELMVDAFTFPHIPYWFTIKEAMWIIKKAFLEGEKCVRPMVVLVFDEKYNLVGTLTPRQVLRGLEPKFMKTSAKIEGIAPDESLLSIIWDTLYYTESKNLSEYPVTEVMKPIQFFVEPDDPVTKASYIMIRNDLIVLPVLEKKKKLVGIITTLDIFTDLSNIVLNE